MYTDTKTYPLISAKQLRNEAVLKNIPVSIGYYKWFAKKEDVEKLLQPLHVDFETVRPFLETRGDLYAIYLGIAKKSLRQRLGWHVNDKHNINTVGRGLLSTLRQSISSLVGQDQADEVATNDFIDRLFIEYTQYLDLDPDNPVDKKIVEEDETQLINNDGTYHYILNGAKNKYKIKELRKVRSAAKKAGIRRLEGSPAEMLLAMDELKD